MRHRVIAVVASVGVLLICAIPYLEHQHGRGRASPLCRTARLLSRDTSCSTVTSPSARAPLPTIVVDGDVAHARPRRGVCELRTAGAGRPLGPPRRRAARQKLAVITVPVAGTPTRTRRRTPSATLRNRYLPGAMAGTDCTHVTGASARTSTTSTSPTSTCRSCSPSCSASASSC